MSGQAKESSDNTILTILNDNRKTIGVMKEVTAESMADPRIISKITQWRNKFKKFFLTQFTATETRTRQWLSTSVIENPSRILFLLYTEEDKLIGHMGFTDIKNDQAELDNLLRGEMGGDPNLVYHAEKTLVAWAFQTLGVSAITLGVLGNNALAITLHESIGFTKSHIDALHKTNRDSETHYSVAKDGEGNVPFKYQHMVLRKQDFQKI